jgi:ribosomal protein S18 acetylase RimI-like enzyme
MCLQPPITIRPLTEDDAAAFLALKREALTTCPDRFGGSLEDEAESSPERVRERLARATVEKGEVVLGAFAPGLIGAVALTRDLRAKYRHKADLHEMYVRPEHRGRGVAKMLMRQALAVARKVPGLELLHGFVVVHNHAAMALYRQFGFVRSWTEERFLKCGERYIDAHHIVLDLTRAPG